MFLLAVLSRCLSMAYYSMVLFHLFTFVDKHHNHTVARVNVCVSSNSIPWETKTSTTFTELSVNIKRFHITKVLYSIIFGEEVFCNFDFNDNGNFPFQGETSYYLPIYIAVFYMFVPKNTRIVVLSSFL